MLKKPVFHLVALLTAILLTGCGPVEDTRPGQPVKTRQTAFKEMLKVFEPMGLMLRENRYDADKFLAMTDSLIARRDAPWAHFAPDTNYPPTKATEQVWQDSERFERERLAFFAATDRLQAAAQSKEKSTVETAYKAVYETCQNCHKPFKAR